MVNCYCKFVMISEPGYEFDKDSLLEYNPMSFGGPPVKTDTIEEADELLSIDQKESDIGKHLKRYCLFTS